MPLSVKRKREISPRKSPCMGKLTAWGSDIAPSLRYLGIAAGRFSARHAIRSP